MSLYPYSSNGAWHDFKILSNTDSNNGMEEILKAPTGVCCLLRHYEAKLILVVTNLWGETKSPCCNRR